MSILDFIRQYYTDPIVMNEGYNFVNTATYAIIAVLLTYISFKLLEKMKVRVDKGFSTAIISLVVFGTLIRLFEEAKIFSSYFLVTPLIWLEVFSFVLVLFLVSKYIQSKFNIAYHKVMLFAGVGLSLLPLIVLISKVTQVQGMLLTVGVLSPMVVILYFVKWNNGNKLVTLAHAFDASATFVATQFFGFTELHVVPRLLITNFSPISFIFVKMVVVVSILFLIDRSSSDRNFNNFLKLIIAIIGFAPGLRDFFLLGIS